MIGSITDDTLKAIKSDGPLIGGFNDTCTSRNSLYAEIFKYKNNFLFHLMKRIM